MWKKQGWRPKDSGRKGRPCRTTAHVELTTGFAARRIWGGAAPLPFSLANSAQDGRRSDPLNRDGGPSLYGTRLSPAELSRAKGNKLAGKHLVTAGTCIGADCWTSSTDSVAELTLRMDCGPLSELTVLELTEYQSYL
ncbi:hypothetical protein AAFF_G00251400 [Aldrovandia affinis]|uniref:Uncharacterized protein n=1 Tax=Aldrovandia affinis TaxID=143900 RepID=A0AAD7RCL7_9TELE|nr:hypothetical protein AAFF_G00251400 [Aldrovandia affinis]